MIEVDKTGGKGSFFDQVQNYGYVNGQLYRDKNEYIKATGGSSGVFDTGSGQSFGNSGSGNSFGFSNTQQPAFDPVASFQKLMEGSGIKESQAQIDTISKLAMEKEAAKNQAIAGVNDNPFYSEATRVGRSRKVEESANADIKTLTDQAIPLQNKIAMQKADIDTQLGLETQRYNIRSQEAQQAQQQFSTMLSSGALDNASGDDIANIVRATGMSSNMIQAAIESTKKKNNPVSFQEFDDGTNTGYAVIDSQGNILSKQIVAGSKPSAAEEKAAGGGGDVKPPSVAQLKVDAGTAAKKGKTYQDMLKFFVTQGLSAKEVYNIYTAANYYGRPPDGVDPKTGQYIKK